MPKFIVEIWRVRRIVEMCDLLVVADTPEQAVERADDQDTPPDRWFRVEQDSTENVDVRKPLPVPDSTTQDADGTWYRNDPRSEEPSALAAVRRLLRIENAARVWVQAQKDCTAGNTEWAELCAALGVSWP